MKKVAVVLVNYKTYVNRFLEECRDSLRLQEYPADQIKVYIVDNASSEESRAYIAQNYPEAVIVPREDGNYAAANNAGIAQGMKDGCEYFVIANMDVKYDKRWLPELVIALENNPQAGLVQSKILLYPQNEEEWSKPKINTLGNIMHYLGFGFTSYYKEEDFVVTGYPKIEGYASGCSFIVSREVIEKIGTYNEEYYMYHDDVEMSWRAKLAGYDILLAPLSVLYHKYEFGRSVLMIYYMERNRYLAMFHYYKWQTILLISPMILFMEAGMIAYAILNRWWSAKWKAIRYFYSFETWKKILKTRKEIKQLRLLSDRILTRPMEGRVLYQEIANPLLVYVVNPIMLVYWKIVSKIIVW
ncbi:glycosyltransferase family 2 protein [Candidatus Falkowbacteria bacterium]|nr:glycosyltransferase family 2 protein [Candidatus Falkowbacteria bacterium]